MSEALESKTEKLDSAMELEPLTPGQMAEYDDVDLTRGLFH